MGKGAPKPPGSTQPQAERGLQIQSSSQGGAIPLRYGENRMAGQVLLAIFFKAIKVPQGAQSGKKSGGGQAAYQYVYTVSAILDLGEGDLPFDRDGNPYNPNRPPELNNIGLARPGRQALSVHESGLTQQALGQDRFVDGGNVLTNPDGTPKLQPKRGTEPGTWRGKNVRHMGLVADPDHAAFKGTHWHQFGVLVPAPSPPGRYIAMPGDDFPPFYEGGQHDKLVTSGTRHYAPEKYPGLSPLAYRNMPLGPNASLPGWNFPYTRMRYAEWVLPIGHDGPGLFVPGSGTASGIRDCAPDHILADFLGSWKHGAGFDELLAMFPGFDPALGDASPFWQEGPESWGAYCRAQECLLSPFYDAQQAASQMLEDLALLTDAAPLFSEGLFKMIPYGDAEVTGPVTGVTFTPVTDPLQYTTGANVGVLPFTMDDFLTDGPAKDDPVVVVRKAVLADGRTSAGYFNAIRLEYVDRLNAYAKSIAEARDEAAIATHGLVVGQPLTANGVTNLALANDIARRYLQRVGQLRDEYRFTVGWQHLLLEPMDVRTIPGEALDPALAGLLITVRVREITENDHGELEVLAQLLHAPLLGTVPATVPDGENPLEAADTNDVWPGVVTLDPHHLTGVHYMDPAGDTGATTLRTNVVYAMPGPVDLSALAVRVAFVSPDGFDSSLYINSVDTTTWPVGGSLILRPNVNGVPHPDLEVTVDAIGRVFLAEAGPIHLEAGDELCLEIEGPGIGEAGVFLPYLVVYFSLRYARATYPIQLRKRFFDPGPPDGEGFHWGVLNTVNDCAAYNAPLPRDLTIHTVTVTRAYYVDTYTTTWFTDWDWAANTGTAAYTDTHVVTTAPETWTYSPEITLLEDHNAILRLDGPFASAKTAVLYELGDVDPGMAVYCWNFSDSFIPNGHERQTRYAPFGTGQETVSGTAGWQQNPTFVRVPWAGTGLFKALIVTFGPDRSDAIAPLTAVPSPEEYNLTLLVDGRPTDLKLLVLGDNTSTRFEAWFDVPIAAGQDVCLQVDAVATLVSGVWTFLAAGNLSIHVLYVGAGA